MSTTLAPPSASARAYDVLAPVYDLLTSGYAHDRWVGALEGLAREYGLQGSRVLDVACGTGKSFMPLLRRGYDVTACDVSPGMVERARERSDGVATIVEADVRALPPLGEFDLVTCLLDVLNHLVERDDVLAALASMREQLAPDGLVVFDVNSLIAYREVPDAVVDDGRHLVVWHGAAAQLEEAGGCGEVVIDVFAHDEGDVWRRSESRQRHRHHPLPTIRALAEESGLRIVAERGQRTGGVLEAPVDEARHPKVVLLAARA